MILQTSFLKDKKSFLDILIIFEIDLLASSFVGLSEWYLQAFLSKSRIYVEYFNIYIGYQEYYESTYAPENINMFMEFWIKIKKYLFLLTNWHSKMKNLKDI